MAFALIIRAIAASLLVTLPAAKEVPDSFDIYSDAKCGDTLSALSETFDLSQSKNGNETDFITHCASMQLNLREWPQTNGQYEIYVDTSVIDDQCQIIFYTGPPSDDEIDTSDCFQFYRAVHSDSNCALLWIPPKFGYAYCCNSKCTEALSQSSRREVDPTPLLPSDVTAIKRSSILRRKKKKEDDCKFVETDPTIRTMYGRQQKVSSQEDCPSSSPFGCPLNGEISLGQTIGTSTSLSVSTGFTAGFLGIGASVGIDTTTSQEWSSSTTFGVSYSLTIAAGDKAYLTFMPKYKCVHGKFEGTTCDASLNIGEQQWCVPALIQGNVTDGPIGPIPDGIWSVVEVN